MMTQLQKKSMRQEASYHLTRVNNPLQCLHVTLSETIGPAE